jgi:hypothetical protein
MLFICAFISEALIRHIPGVNLVQQVCCDEGVLFLNILLRVDVPNKEPPEAGDYVSDHKYNDDQTEDLVRVHDHILGLDPV